MVIEIALFGRSVFAMMVRGGAGSERDEEVISNDGGDFDIAMPFGFAMPDEDEDEEVY